MSDSLFQTLEKYQIGHYYPQFTLINLSPERICSTPRSDLLSLIRLSDSSDTARLASFFDFFQETHGGIVPDHPTPGETVMDVDLDRSPSSLGPDLTPPDPDPDSDVSMDDDDDDDDFSLDVEREGDDREVVELDFDFPIVDADEDADMDVDGVGGVEEEMSPLVVRDSRGGGGVVDVDGDGDEIMANDDDDDDVEEDVSLSSSSIVVSEDSCSEDSCSDCDSDRDSSSSSESDDVVELSPDEIQSDSSVFSLGLSGSEDDLGGNGDDSDSEDDLVTPVGRLTIAGFDPQAIFQTATSEMVGQKQEQGPVRTGAKKNLRIGRRPGAGPGQQGQLRRQRRRTEGQGQGQSRKVRQKQRRRRRKRRRRGVRKANPTSKKPKPKSARIRKTKICVAVRKRPLNASELARGENDVIECRDRQTLLVHEPKVKVDLTQYVQISEYLFDEVFDETISNELVYERTARPLIDHVLSHGVGTCFAYGQTGAGKTFTMIGCEGNPGIYILASRDLFRRLDPTRHEAYLSYFEIYGGKLFDLLNGKQRLVLREDARNVVNVVGLKQIVVATPDDVIQKIDQGNSVRQVGSTGANDESSRSHAILGIEIREVMTGKVFGKVSFVDLAGSERGADTYHNDKQTRLEGAEINKSLLALKECIRSLDQELSHVPFRGSKLTAVLRDSFLGNSRTVMIAAVSPNASSCEHTLNTLRYADRVKEMRKRRKKANDARKATAYYPQKRRNMRVIPRPLKKPFSASAEASGRPRLHHRRENLRGRRRPDGDGDELMQDVASPAVTTPDSELKVVG